MSRKEITTSSIYLMHKYWGKKPSDELRKIIDKYTDIGNIVLDPFAGFGGIAIESLLQNRNVIINDLNPVAVFIANVILNDKVDLQKFDELFCQVKEKYESFRKEWYSYKGMEIYTILRDSEDNPLKIRVKNSKTKKFQEIVLSFDESSAFLLKENEYKINTWYPTDLLIVNSRISAKHGMRVCDLFSKRALICQSYLYSLISTLIDSPEKDLLMLSFTSNLANCSKLVPPIVSRGDMAQGAWMTGFFIGEKYLENNVFHYFENRVAKSIKGKKDYYELRQYNNVHSYFTVLNEDAKELSIEDSSIDFVFTDFPYGDTVPYFEQSQLWNSWLQKKVDYNNEIVISDSIQRNKNIDDFETGILKSVGEISRVLRENKFFVFTFHSLYGREWKSIVKALKHYNFEFIECDILIQKTLPPRQLNRSHSIKGDIVAVYQKRNVPQAEKDFNEVLLKNFDEACLKKNTFETNDLIVICIKSMLSSNFEMNDIEFKELISKYFVIDEISDSWRRKK